MLFGPKMMAGRSFTPVIQTYTTSQSVAPPEGAAFADIELWGGGGGHTSTGGGAGGEGGSYAKKTVSLADVTSIHLSIPGYGTGDGSPANATVNGVNVCAASGGYAGGYGHNPSPNVGDVTYRGGLGLKYSDVTWFTGETYFPGGGAAGPNGPGGDAWNETDGSSYGYYWPGNAGSGNAAAGTGAGLGGQGGQLYGGGNSTTDPRGMPGAARITFR